MNPGLKDGPSTLAARFGVDLGGRMARLSGAGGDPVFDQIERHATGARAPAQALSARAARSRVFYTRVDTDPLRPGVTRITIRCVMQMYNKSEMSADRRPYRRECEQNRRDALIEAALGPVRLADVSAIRNIDLEVAAA